MSVSAVDLPSPANMLVGAASLPDTVSHQSRPLHVLVGVTAWPCLAPTNVR